MNTEISTYIAGYPPEIQDMFAKLRTLVTQCMPGLAPEEKLWAKLPSYYSGECFVRLIPFKNHINVEAIALANYRAALSGFKFTPKGMLQIAPGQPVPEEVLKAAFAQTLGAR